MCHGWPPQPGVWGYPECPSLLHGTARVRDGRRVGYELERSPLVARGIEHSAATGSDGAGGSLVGVKLGEDEEVHAASTTPAARGRTTSATLVTRRVGRRQTSSLRVVTAQPWHDVAHFVLLGLVANRHRLQEAQQ
jgi:hypothetical protein